MSKVNKKQQILQIAQEKGVISAADLLERNIPREYLSRYARQGLLAKIDRGLYRLPGHDLGENESLIEVSKKVPKGVISLLSALRFHGITTENPFEVWMALANKSWLPKTNYPPVRFIFFSDQAMAAGVETHLLSGVEVKVFNPAKTVADCFKFRNKIGLDVALDALREGWRKKLFTMDEIFRYAKICRVHKVIRPYVETLV